MTIPADHISFNNDGTAWLVVAADPAEYGWAVALNRPCDTCDGEGGVFRPSGSVVGVCSDCDGTGRYTFTIEVLYDERWNSVVQGFPVRTYRVSVIPGMVLEIHGIGSGSVPLPGFWKSHGYGWWVLIPEGTSCADVFSRKTYHRLPPAAAPGMWAVKLKVAR